MSTAPHFDLRPRQGLIQRVVAVLRTQIAQGAWPVGSRIPTEPELSKLTGVGRNTVREAVQSLVHAGMLERRQGSGTYVLADNEVVVQLTRFAGPDGERHTESAEAFGALWVHVCRLAATRRTPRQAEDLAEATLDLIGDPATVVGSTSDLGMSNAPAELHPVIQVVLEAGASSMVTDLVTGLLKGIAEGHTVRCPGEALVSCARSVASGSTEAAAIAGLRVAENLTVQPRATPPLTS